MTGAARGRPAAVVFDVGDFGPESLFRIVRTGDPNAPDLMESLMSHFALGRPPRGHERRSAVLHMGLSTWETAEQAAGVARRWPVIGSYVACLSLRRGHGFNIAPTNMPGHYTLWGRPVQLRDVVVDIVPVEEI